MKILHLFAGLGANRLLWEDVEVTAIELRADIGEQYAKNFPDDEIIMCGDAHAFLETTDLDSWDFIWSSPPCQSHSRAAAKGHNQTPRYPDMMLWQEVIFLQTHCQCPYVVENVHPYYYPLIAGQKIGRHMFWSNFHVVAEDIKPPAGLFESTREEIQAWLGIGYEGNIYYGDNHDPLQILRNCCHPEIGLAVLNSAIGVTDDTAPDQYSFL